MRMGNLPDYVVRAGAHSTSAGKLFRNENMSTLHYLIASESQNVAKTCM